MDKENITNTPKQVKVSESFRRLKIRLDILQKSLSHRVHGRDKTIYNTLAGIIAGGHILLQGPPGMGKSYFIRLLAASLRAEVRFFREEGPLTGCNIAVIDEIDHCESSFHRTLLSAMQEGEVTVAGEPCYLNRPFIVLGILNESEPGKGLPAALLDRFSIRLTVTPPAEKYEKAIIASASLEDNLSIPKYASPDELLRIQRMAEAIPAAGTAVALAARIISAARNPESYGLEKPQWLIPPSSRAGVQLLQLCRAFCLMNSRSRVNQKDIRSNLVNILSHRIAPLYIDPREVEEFIHKLSSLKL